MERNITIEDAKKIFGKYFIGIEELRMQSHKLGISIPNHAPAIPYSRSHLEKLNNDYILILGIPFSLKGEIINIKSFYDYFGTNPLNNEPCFYNQDWYINEEFIFEPLRFEWFLIRKNVYEITRSQSPDNNLIINKYPTAIQCVYTFFASWFCTNEVLWQNDYVWCSNVDHNGDRIYVGRYFDATGLNKKGFSIHRHLKLRNNYGCIDCI